MTEGTVGRLRWTAGELLDEQTRNGLIGPGGPFELREAEVLGRTVPVFAQQARSVGALVTNAAGHGERPFLTGPDGTLRFDQLPGAVATRYHRLAEQGVRPGDRVLLAARTSHDLILAILGTMAHGAVAALANPAWTAAELERATQTGAPALAVADDDVMPRLPDALPSIALSDLDRDWDGGHTPDWPDRAHGAHLLHGAHQPDEPVPTRQPHGVHEAPTVAAPAPPPPTVRPDDPCALVFTSGTTGAPRGALLSHRNAVHFCMSTALTSLTRGLTTGVAPRAAGPPTVIASAPLFHVSGLLGQLINAVSWGMTLVVAPPGRWGPTTHLQLTEAHQVTTWSLVPTQLRRIVEHPELHRFDLSSLATVGGGGSTFPPELLRRVEDLLPHVRAGLRIGYGMTETAGTVTLLEPPVADHEVGSVGRAVAGAEIEVRSPTGHPLPEGEVGQIWARSASVFLGYQHDPEATSAALDEQGWYATGDSGRIEGEVLHLESRLRDLIIRGGENIYPIEIENRLVEHPGISAAAVVGAPDEDLGQVVRAVLVAGAGTVPSTAEVQNWVAAELARYKVPTVVEWRAELPVNALGKVLRHQL